MQKISYEERRSLPNISAVYVVRNETEVLYVGSTWTLRQRFASHHRRDAFAMHGATVIEWQEASEEEIAEIERRLVRELSPLLNRLASRPKQRKEAAKPNPVIANSTWWRDETIADLKAYVEGKAKDKTFAEISDACGFSVGWLKTLAAGKIDNPGILYIGALSEYLNKKKAAK